MTFGPIATAPTIGAVQRPVYWCGFATCVKYTDDALHNPISIPGSIYCHEDGAEVLLNRSVGGRIPLGAFSPGAEVILHFPSGIICGVSRIDAGRNLSVDYKASIQRLVKTLVERGVRVTLYAPSLQHTPDAGIARYALDDYTSWAVQLKVGLIIDAAMWADDFAANLVDTGKRLRNAGLPFGGEGLATPKVQAAIGDLITVQVLEQQSVRRTFQTPDDPAWKTVVRPDPSKLLIWDQDASWSTPHMATLLRQGPCLPGRSGIGAEGWRIGAPGGPRLAVSRDDAEGRALLGVAQAVPG